MIDVTTVVEEEPTGLAPGATPGWPLAFAARLVVSDCAAIFLAVLGALLLRFGPSLGRGEEVPYALVAAVLGPAWLVLLYLGRCYELRFLGLGSTEFRRVGIASVKLFTYVAVTCYVLHINLARGYVAIAFPLGTVLLLGGRYIARRWLHGKRRDGGWSHRVIIVGDTTHVRDLAEVLTRQAHVGFTVVGACLPAGGEGRVADVPVVGALTSLLAQSRRLAADTIAVTSSPGITSATVRQLSWELEGTGMTLVLAPALTDVAGPRISIRPVQGLPLLQLDAPEFAGARRVAKEAQDRLLAVLLLVTLSPLLATIALAVRLTSRGPVLFRQQRVGHRGETFSMLKFRSMVTGAESQLVDLQQRNDAAGVLFKLHDDPRVTPLGRRLRAWSLDELPQLINVLRGDMALVGPRPPLPDEVARYASRVHRRLLVKPGMTGLWQVNGRSNLTWEESVRLDLYYVENWSLALDLMILWKTLFVVAGRIGAY